MALLGSRFAYRHHPKRMGEPVQPVEVVLEPPRRFQKVRIRYLTGELAGLEEWVPKGRLVVPWDEAEAFMRDEHCKTALLDAVGNDLSETLPYRAIERIFIASSYHDSPTLGWTMREANLLRIEDFDVTVNILNLPKDTLLAYPLAFVDRLSIYWGPYEAAEDLARLLCRQNPGPILEDLSRAERRLRREAVQGVNQGFREHAERSLALEAPVFAMVREWCGGATVEEFNEVQELQDEVSRLRRLVESAVGDLQANGHKMFAARLVKELINGAHAYVSDIDQFLGRQGESMYRSRDQRSAELPGTPAESDRGGNSVPAPHPGPFRRWKP